MTTYKEVIKNAWKVAWKPKSIWLFGLFASCFGIGGGVAKSLDLTGGRNILINLWQTLLSVNFFSAQTLRSFPQLFLQNPISITISVLIFLIVGDLTLIVLILAIISQSTIIKAVVKRYEGKKVSYLEGISFGLDRFWQILGLNVIIRFIAFVVFAFLVYVAAKTSGVLFVILAVVYALLLLISIVASFIIRYATCHLVTRDDGFVESLKKGKELFLRHWLTTIEIALILLIIQILFLFGGTLLIKLDTLILYIVFVAINLLKITALSNFIVFLTLASITMIVLVLISFFSVFSWAVWTILTFELEKDNVFSKIKGWLKLS